MESRSDAALFAPPDVVTEPAGGGWLLRSAEPLGDHPVSVIHSLRAWAHQDPGHPLVAERAQNGSWRTCTYGEAAAAAESIGQALLDLGLGPGRRC
jgi:feruloyl-CoA synthase